MNVGQLLQDTKWLKALNRLHSATIDTQALVVELMEDATPERWDALAKSIAAQLRICQELPDVRETSRKRAIRKRNRSVPPKNA